jgi:hypothetical protein
VCASPKPTEKLKASLKCRLGKNERTDPIMKNLSCVGHKLEKNNG